MAKENASLPGRAREAAYNDVTVLRAAREILPNRVGMHRYRPLPHGPAWVSAASIADTEARRNWRNPCVSGRSTTSPPSPECMSTAKTDEAVLKTFFSRYLTESVGPLIPVLGGKLPEHAEVTRAAEELEAALQSMVDVCIDAREVPPDFTAADVMLMTVHLRPTLPIEGDRATEIHTRYLDFMLDGLRGGTPRPTITPRPGANGFRCGRATDPENNRMTCQVRLT